VTPTGLEPVFSP